MSFENIESDALAAQIVAYRVLGFNRDRAILCMEELVARKSAGDTFDYESYIKSKVEAMPKPKPIEFNKISALGSIKNSLLDLKSKIKL